MTTTSLTTLEETLFQTLKIGEDPFNIYGYPEPDAVTRLADELRTDDEVSIYYGLKRLSALRLLPKQNPKSNKPLRDQVQQALDSWPDLARVDARGRPYSGRVQNLARHTVATVPEVEAVLIDLLREVVVQ